MREYDSALKYSDQALRIYDTLIDFNGDADLINPLSANVNPFKKYNKEIVFYSSMNSNIVTQLPSIAKCDTTLYSEYTNDDLRKTGFFKPEASYFSFKGSYSTIANTLFTGIATDELILIKAECLARVGGANYLGDKEAALKELNRLRKFRYKKDVFTATMANSLDETLKKILIERRKELIMRGLRWSDIKRLNKEGLNIILKRTIGGQSYLLMPNDNKYAQPIPQEIIIRLGIPQNPR